MYVGYHASNTRGRVVVIDAGEAFFFSSEAKTNDKQCGASVFRYDYTGKSRRVDVCTTPWRYSRFVLIYRPRPRDVRSDLADVSRWRRRLGIIENVCCLYHRDNSLFTVSAAFCLL